MSRTSDYFPTHCHSHLSSMDGMNEISQIAERVSELGQVAFASTEHGNMAGTVQGYKAAQKLGLAFYPGEEFYMVRDVHDDTTKGTRYHLGMLALDQIGYEAMVKLSTLSWKPDRFYYKPLIDLSDLAFLSEEGYADHLAITTGCYSSLTVQALLGQTGGTMGEAHLPIIKMLANWFPNTTYVELQNHGITWREHGVDDVWIMEALHEAAQTLGLPVVFGADSHYVLPDQQPVHDLMKDICYFGAGEDVHFSGGPYHLLSADEVEAKAPKFMADIEAGHADLLNRHALRLPPLDNYKFQVPSLFKNADDVLREQSERGLQERMDDVSDIYWNRLDAELDVIAKMGMANYHLLVKTHVTEWCRDNGIITNTRGSANGSLVCYAIGITNVDPIQWKTSFDRYLSLNRMKPPDIDVDVDFKGRSRLIEHLVAVFPTLTQVGTYSRIGFAKEKPGEVVQDDDRRGSIIVQYMAAMRKKDPNFSGKVLSQHWEPLEQLAETPVYKSMGKNAAGFILPGDGHPIHKYLPQARIISSDSTVTQFDKDDVEAMGYLKIDLLGLKALQTLNGTLTAIGRPVNQWDWIPVDDKAALEVIRKNHTAGVFQYEGWTQGKGGKEMGVRSTQDVIFGLALYRPALINGGQKDLYLANRKYRSKAKQQRLHRIFDSVLDDTAGVPLYQEQIMQMLQVVGMPFAEYNELMTAIKASNGFIANAAKTIAKMEPLFYDLAEAKNLSDQDTDDAWRAVVGFTEYGFNRAHSSAYGLMSYYSAYLKAHYPMEFMLSLLSVWSDDKDRTRDYTGEARRLGYFIVKPDVNVSGLGWVKDPKRKNALRKGLVAIPGVGENTAQVIVAERDVHGPYRSIQDFVDRLPARPVSGGSKWASHRELVGVCRTLFEANAFRSVGNQ